MRVELCEQIIRYTVSRLLIKPGKITSIDFTHSDLNKDEIGFIIAAVNISMKMITGNSDN